MTTPSEVFPLTRTQATLLYHEKTDSATTGGPLKALIPQEFRGALQKIAPKGDKFCHDEALCAKATEDSL